jgi:hypothetical protein
MGYFVFIPSLLLHSHVNPTPQYLLTWLSDDMDADRAKRSVIHGLARKRIHVNFCWWTENLCWWWWLWWWWWWWWWWIVKWVEEIDTFWSFGDDGFMSNLSVIRDEGEWWWSDTFGDQLSHKGLWLWLALIVVVTFWVVVCGDFPVVTHQLMLFLKSFLISWVLPDRIKNREIKRLWLHLGMHVGCILGNPHNCCTVYVHTLIVLLLPLMTFRYWAFSCLLEFQL